MATSKVVFTGKTVTAVHGNRSAGRRCKCRGCGGMFTASRATATYCSTACRSSAYRTRHKPRQRVKPIPVIVSTCCAHCGSRFAASAGRGQLYCTPSCKTLAYRARRSAAIEALAAYSGIATTVAADVVERAGLARAASTLRALGMVYDQRSRAWLVPVGQVVEVRARVDTEAGK